MAIIEINNLSKRYRRSQPQHKLSTFGEVLAGALKSPLRRLRRATTKPSGNDFFWALRDINLHVDQGEVVGIIGRNGAGKSTLLKVLSRITEPTSGQIVLRGRMASLLEVGTGFHPELTGRENIFLNGAILGMKKHEIRSKFDEIVAFSEIEDFLDTPVKRYSSGMYVRLAFAVAAHLEPEILIVDEVLAVGDTAFQRKCLGKMGEVSRQGRTVLFVSHNMAAVENLCTRGVLLERGQLAFDGSVKDVIHCYLRSLSNIEAGLADLSNARGRAPIYQSLAKTIELLDGDGLQLPGPLPLGQTLRVRIRANFPERISEPEIGIGFDTLFGQRLFTVSTTLDPGWNVGEVQGDQQFVCEISGFPLSAGEYKIRLFVRAGGSLLDVIDDAARLQVVESDFFGTGRQPYGLFAQRASWVCSRPEGREYRSASSDGVEEISRKALES